MAQRLLTVERDGMSLQPLSSVDHILMHIPRVLFPEKISSKKGSPAFNGSKHCSFKICPLTHLVLSSFVANLSTYCHYLQGSGLKTRTLDTQVAEIYFLRLASPSQRRGLFTPVPLLTETCSYLCCSPACVFFSSLNLVKLIKKKK